MYRRLLVLALGTFAVGTDGFVIAGILPEISRSLHTNAAATGLLVTMFAFTYAVSSPIIAATTAHWPRKRLLIAGLLILAVGNVLTAALPLYGLVLASRVIAGLGAGMFTLTASATAASLVEPHQRGRALAVVMAGLSSATALGAPIGTVIGSQTNWQTTLWFVAALAVLGAVGVAVLLPAIPAAHVAGLRERLATMKDARIGFTLLTTLLVFTGLFTDYTFVGESFDRATGGNGIALAILLFLWGAGATVGSVTAGHLTDRISGQRIIAVAVVVVGIDFALLPFSSRTFATAAVALFVWGVCGWATLVPLQHRLIEVSPEHAPVSIGLNASATYLATAASGLTGAAGIAAFGAYNLGPFGLIFLALGLVASIVSARFVHTRRSAPAAPVPAAAER
ncbi:MFS transporter [Amycolatopsis sp. NPDC051372]|uniref:MFS transporter n=1 Tax=Amycolatopsis sp. NPDC051372 TaxID=3155669 RepID=UPI003415D308